jgi:hypothetical protein
MNRWLFGGALLPALSLVLPAFARDEQNAAAPAPATLARVRDAVDWTKLPRPDGARPGRNGFSLCTFRAPGTFAEVAEFFRTSLRDLGWREESVPGVDQKSYLYLSFQKGEMSLSINGYRTDPKALMAIFLTNGGNVDVRQIPKPADAKFRSNLRSSAFYTTAAAPADAGDFCRKALLDRNWKEVPADSAKFFAKEGRIVLRFLQNAMEIGVVVSKNMAGETEVTLFSKVRQTFDARDVRDVLTPAEVPVPPTVDDYVAVIDLREFPLMNDATKRERQSTPVSRSNAITCQAPATLEDAMDFHRKELLKRGWKETRADMEIADRAEVQYEKQGYLMTVELGQPKNEALQISVINHGNVDIRQLPYPPGTEISPERDAFLNCTTSTSVNEAVDFYRKEMAKLGWVEVKERGRGSYHFLRNASHLSIEIGKDINDRTALQLRAGLLSAE